MSSYLPNAHTLIAGIAHYPHINPLPATVLNDAAAIQRVLVDPTLCAYEPTQVTLLPEEMATQTGLLQALSTLAANSDSESTVFLYLSCHGARFNSGPATGEYLLPYNVKFGTETELGATSISATQFTRALRAIPDAQIDSGVGLLPRWRHRPTQICGPVSTHWFI